MPHCKEVTSPTAAGIRPIHLLLGKALVPGSQPAMQTARDLQLSGSAAAVPTFLREPLPACSPPCDNSVGLHPAFGVGFQAKGMEQEFSALHHARISRGKFHKALPS